MKEAESDEEATGDDEDDEGSSSDEEETSLAQDPAQPADEGAPSKPEKVRSSYMVVPMTPNTPVLQPAVRTKYDRMFERKNQKFEHHKKLLDHDDDVSEGDDFITLKREDHGLSSDSESGHREDNLSKRKLKMSKSKRVQLKSTELGTKLIFDEEGNPHELYEMADADEFFKAGPEGVKDAGRKFVEGERGRLKVADVLDKEEAKEKKREKKRKRKEREKGVSNVPTCGYRCPLILLFRICRTMMVQASLCSPHPPRTTATSPLTSIYHLKTTRTCLRPHRNEAEHCQWGHPCLH